MSDPPTRVILDNLGLPPCFMSTREPLAIYSFPFMDKEVGSTAVCLALFSPYFLIDPVLELCDLFEDLEREEEFTYRLQIFPQRVEFHTTGLSYVTSLKLLTFLSSKTFASVGEWGFIASELGSCHVT